MLKAELKLLRQAQQQCGVFSRAQVIAAVADAERATQRRAAATGRTGVVAHQLGANGEEGATSATSAARHIDPGPTIVRRSDELISRRLAERRWVRLAPGVYGDAFRPATFERRLWAAVLAAGWSTSVSHQAAAACWGFALSSWRWNPPVVVLTTHGNHARVRNAKVRQTTRLPAAHLTTLRGLPITTPERTVVDLAAVLPRARVGELLDEALIHKKVSLPRVSSVLAAVAAPGRRGVGALGAAIDERSDGEVPPASHLERLLRQAVARGGLPPLSWQHPFPGRREVGSCVDGAHVDAKLIVEVDGRRWHTRVADLRRDHARDREAALAGWDTLRLLWEDVAPDVAAAGQLIAATIEVRLEQLGMRTAR